MGMDRKIRLVTAQKSQSDPPAENESPPAGADPGKEETKVSADSAPAPAPAEEPKVTPSSSGGLKLRPAGPKRGPGERRVGLPPGVPPPPGAEPPPSPAPEAGEPPTAPRSRPMTLKPPAAPAAPAAPTPAPPEAAEPEAAPEPEPPPKKEEAKPALAEKPEKKAGLKKKERLEPKLTGRWAEAEEEEEEGKKEPSGGATDLGAPQIVGIVLLVLALVPVSVPLVKECVETKSVPIVQLAVPLVITFLVILFVVAKKMALRIIALVLVGLFAALAIAGPFLATLLGDSEAIQVATPTAGQCFGAGCVYVASLVILTGGGVVRWIVMSLFIVAGAALPWVPVEDFLPIEAPAAKGAAAGGEAAGGEQTAAAGPTAAKPATQMATTSTYSVPLPAKWEPQPASAGAALASPLAGSAPGATADAYTSADGSVSVTIACEATVADVSLDDFVQQQIARVRQKHPGDGEFVMNVPGQPNRKKVTLLTSGARVELLVVDEERYRYTLAFAGGQAAFSTHQSEISDMMKRFQPAR